MLVTNHVLSGAAIGAAVRRPVPAFLLGVASHFALDAAPHWGRSRRWPDISEGGGARRAAASITVIVRRCKTMQDDVDDGQDAARPGHRQQAGSGRPA